MKANCRRQKGKIVGGLLKVSLGFCKGSVGGLIWINSFSVHIVRETNVLIRFFFLKLKVATVGHWNYPSSQKVINQINPTVHFCSYQPL